jgi:hypothetical protein
MKHSHAVAASLLPSFSPLVSLNNPLEPTGSLDSTLCDLSGSKDW